MPTIRPASYLKDHFKEISKMCQEKKEPVFLTHNGKESFVLLSNEQYESLIVEKETKDELYRLLEESEKDDRPRVRMEEAMKVFDEATNVAKL
ncbi:type II toxin-antitoxin system Phd/YefM family antitoxin [candidate division KSB1 bacterium]|nr:type II toxin-antitoxin system Phd/YefM family antitoxin [candidate division KSB1 bacterium]